MTPERERLKKLARQLADLTAERKPPKLSIVPVKNDQFAEPERIWIREQIMSLRRIYALDWFVRQEMYGKLDLRDLDDEDLLALLRSVERAVCCIRDGVSFEDAGLIRTQPDT
jgi:hypothetical protein